MSKRKILLADDSITIQKVVNLTFADEGIDVVTVGDGDSALERLSAEVPDILLADVNMPGPTGYEICERLRQDEATQNLPVILLVGSFEPFDEAEASRVGANAYLTKPFQSIRQLIQQVNELIEASSPAVAEPESDTVESVEQVAGEPHPSTTAETVPLPAIEEASQEPEVVSEFAESSPESGIAVETNATEAFQEEKGTTEPRFFDDLGYVSNIPPVETSQTAPSDDIEGLYERSLASDEGSDLSEIGIDDEMIETSYTAADANTDLANFSAVPDAEAENVVIGDFSGPADSPVTEGTPESTQSDIGFVSGYDQTFPEDPSRFENTIAYENWRPPDVTEDDGISHSSNESISVERPDESQDPAGLEGVEHGHADHAGPVGEDTIPMASRFDTTGSAQYQFDDVDLLDLAASDEHPIEITSPAHAVEQGSSKQVVTLSPELIEMIAQRVVEKLSEKY